MALHPEKYGDGLLVTGGRNEVLISMTDGKNVTKCRIFSFAEARAIAEDILQCCAEVKDDADAD